MTNISVSLWQFTSEKSCSFCCPFELFYYLAMRCYFMLLFFFGVVSLMKKLKKLCPYHGTYKKSNIWQINLIPKCNVLEFQKHSRTEQQRGPWKSNYKLKGCLNLMHFLRMCYNHSVTIIVSVKHGYTKVRTPAAAAENTMTQNYNWHHV